MKNLILVTAFILASFLQMIASDAPKSATLDVVSNEKSIVLNSSSVTEETKTFTITDQSGAILFTDIIEKNKKRVKYDLKRLPNGDYSIKIAGNNSIEFYQATISDNDVSLTNAKTYFRPAIQQSENNIVVSSINLNDEDLQVSIYDSSHELIYKSNEQRTGNFQKTYNLKQLAEGEYNVIVSTDYFSNSMEISL
jgi:hypothetical protein